MILTLQLYLQAKAFDKKTSVLHYVVKLVKKNDSRLLAFSSDISSVIPAESVLLDSLANEVKTLGQELVGVHKTVQAEANRLEEAGELRPMTLEDLKEQRTTVRQVGKVSQFNKMDHHTGRTPMERFTVNAQYSCDQATTSIDDVRKKFLAVLQYFGEDENMATGDFFGILRRFMREFQKAVDQVEAIEKKEVSILSMYFPFVPMTVLMLAYRPRKESVQLQGPQRLQLSIQTNQALGHRRVNMVATLRCRQRQGARS